MLVRRRFGKPSSKGDHDDTEFLGLTERSGEFASAYYCAPDRRACEITSRLYVADSTS